MIIEKHIERKIQRDCFFITGTIKLDSEYFIKKIKAGFESNDNLTNRTFVRDQMTSWNYFVSDEKFINIIHYFMDFVDQEINPNSYFLHNAWGYRLGSGGETRFHDHVPNLWSGALYLNKHKQTLDFPDLNIKIVPNKGKFVLFSSFLQHGSLKHRELNAKYGISFNMGTIPIGGI